MFSRQILLAALATSAALMGADAFAPAARPISLGCERTSAMKPIAVGLAIDDDVATEEDAGEEILSASDLDGEEGTEEAIPARFLSAQRIQELREQHRRHETDTGSPEFQVAGMTERISHLTQHLKEHPKDFSTRRGLVALVNKRRRLLNYLYREDEQRYADIVSALGVRHRVPGAIPSKEDQYGRFPGQKSNKGKSKNKK
jgi:small subunit ribosomal protein S15